MKTMNMNQMRMCCSCCCSIQMMRNDKENINQHINKYKEEKNMKTRVFQIALVLGLQFSLAANAQTEKVTLHVPNFARPLVEKWVTEYQRTNTRVDFQFSGKSQNSDNNISLSTDDDAVLVARYAVLPVIAKGSEAAELIGRHSLNARKLKSLFFVNDEQDDDQDESKLNRQLHVITGNSQQSASRLYATHFKEEIVNYKGKKIQGDDSFLTLAISRDPLGITVNSLSNIFDLESRKVRQTLALVPLDIDRQGRQVLSEGRLDDIIALLEEEQYAEIPVGKVGFDYNHANPILNGFVQWVLQNGTQYVHQYGLLSLSQKDLTAQERKVQHKELAQK